MRAVRLEGVGRLNTYDEPVPTPSADESLVRVSAVGLCGSDLHWFAQGGIGDAVLSRPLVLGHEFGGTVQGGPLDGVRVAVDPAIPCGTCPRCREGNYNLCPQVRFAGHGLTDGGLRDYVAWPTALLVPVPDHFSDATVALLEPLGVAIHCLDLAHMPFSGAVAVVGCGPIGLMLVQLARANGASSVVAVEPLAHRRLVAAEVGADVVVEPEEASGLANRVDVVFEVAGNDEAIAISMSLVRPGGRVVLAGIPDDDRSSFPAGMARRKGLTIMMARRMKETYPRAISLVQRHVIDLGPLVSHSFELGDAAAAFAVACARQGIKTVVVPNGGAAQA